jgi:hypothetical protein
MTEEYRILQKKIRKVESIMEDIEEEQGTNNKVYRAYQRKIHDYELRLNASESYDGGSVTNGELTFEDRRQQSLASIGTTSVSGHPSDRNIDHSIIRKKCRKVYRILKELEEEYGKNEARQRRDYGKYLRKKIEYEEILREADDLVEEHEIVEPAASPDASSRSDEQSAENETTDDSSLEEEKKSKSKKKYKKSKGVSGETKANKKKKKSDDGEKKKKKKKKKSSKKE